MATYLTKEHWNKIRENNKALRATIDKIEITGITAANYAKKFPKLARLVNLEEVIKMKLVSQKIEVPAKVGKVKKTAAKAPAVLLVPAGHITPKELATELKTSPKALRKVIRKLKMTRTGKCWHWSPNSPEVDLIRDAHAKSIQPASKPEQVTAAVNEAIAEAEEEQPTIRKIPPAM